MVKNSKGGNKAKNMARKHMVVKERAVVLKTCALEHYGYVDKVFGGRMCSVVDVKGARFKLHIRGKFKCNAVGVGAIVLFGEREFSSSKEDCDLLYVYEEREYGCLAGIESLIELRNGAGGAKGEGGEGAVDFSMDAPDFVPDDVKKGADGAGSGGGGGADLLFEALDVDGTYDWADI